MYAAENSHGAVTKLLVEAGSDVDAFDTYGLTALMMAISAEANRKATTDHTRVLKTLITASKNVDAQTKSGKTALMIAAREGNDRAVDRLIKKGSNVNMEHSGDGIHYRGAPYGTALLKGIAFCLERAEYKSWMTEKHGWLDNEDSRDHESFSAESMNLLQPFFRHGIQWLDNRNPHRCVQLLLEAGAEVNVSDQAGVTAMMYTVTSHGTLDLSKELIRHGADINAKGQRQGFFRYFLLVSYSYGQTSTYDLFEN